MGSSASSMTHKSSAVLLGILVAAASCASGLVGRKALARVANARGSLITHAEFRYAEEALSMLTYCNILKNRPR